jgi:hypothetical protein
VVVCLERVVLLHWLEEGLYKLRIILYDYSVSFEEEKESVVNYYTHATRLFCFDRLMGRRRDLIVP